MTSEKGAGVDEPTVEPTPTADDPADPTNGWIEPPSSHPLSPALNVVAVLFAFVLFAAFVGGFVTTWFGLGESSALLTIWSSQYDQLPEDFRSGIEARIEAVIPASTDQLSDAQKATWYDDREKGGMVRLDDATLAPRYQIWA